MHRLALVVLAVSPALAFAGRPTPLPEPGTLELLSIGIVAVVIAAIRSRRK